MSQESNPLLLFWIAHYANGESLPEFDPETGRVNLFKEIDQPRLIRFGWYPFTQNLADLLKKHGIRVSISLLNPCELKLGKGQRLIAFRRNLIHQAGIHTCLRCGAYWQFRDRHGSSALPISHATQKQSDKEGRLFESPICPNCGAANPLICHNCKVFIGRTESCPICKTSLPRVIIRDSLEIRTASYFLGFQETIEDRNRKVLIQIFPSGRIEISDGSD